MIIIIIFMIIIIVFMIILTIITGLRHGRPNHAWCLKQSWWGCGGGLCYMDSIKGKEQMGAPISRNGPINISQWLEAWIENKLSYAFQRYHVDDNFHTAFSIIRNISKKVYLNLKRNNIFTLNKLSIIITVNIIVDIMMIIIKIPCVRQTDGRVVDKLGPEQTNGAKQME